MRGRNNGPRAPDGPPRDERSTLARPGPRRRMKKERTPKGAAATGRVWMAEGGLKVGVEVGARLPATLAASRLFPSLTAAAPE